MDNVTALRAFRETCHLDYDAFLRRATPAYLASRISIPWFKEPPLELTIEEALTQATLHSQSHRGQIATALRKLAMTPPLTDFIVWI